MLSQFYPLLHMLKRGVQKLPQNLFEAIRALPLVGTLPSPWTVWLLIALIVYRQRQQWARTFVRKHRPDAFPPGRLFRTALGGKRVSVARRT